MRTTRWIAVALATSTVLAQEPEHNAQEPLPTVQGDWLPFQLPDLDGNLVRYNDSRFAGKVLLVDLWGTWCPPCMAELPDIVRLYERYHDRGFEVLGVATEQMPKKEAITMLRKFVRDREIPYTMVYGGRGHINYYQLPTVSNVESFPQTYIVGRDGRVRVARLGIGDVEATEQLIEDLLDEPVASIVAATQVEEGGSRPVRADRDLLPFRGVDIKGRRYKNGYFFETITYLDPNLDGKPLLVLLWTSTDESSRSALKAMARLHERYGEDGLTIVGAAFEKGPRDPALDRLEAFVADNEIPYQVFYGGDDGVQAIAQTFPTLENVQRVQLPTAILVDRKRRVREIFIGLDPSDREGLERAVQRLTAER